MSHHTEPVPLVDRFWTHVDKSGECWTWTAYRNEHGYGVVGLSVGGTALAHRAAWALTHGPIPDGLLVLHSCDNPPCVRPAHLWLGTQADNVRDRDEKGRGRFGRRVDPGEQARVRAAARTHCVNGHPLADASTYRTPSGGTGRKCRACMRAATSRYRARREASRA